MTEIENTARKLRSTGRLFLAVAILLGLGMLYNGYKTFDLSRDTKADIRASQIQGCQRSNKRVIEQNARIDGQKVVLDAALVVTALSERAYTLLRIPISPEAQRLIRLTPGDIRQLKSQLRPLELTDCRAAYPPLK